MERTRWRERLREPGAVRWYLGSIWGLVYLAIPIILAWVNDPSVSALPLTGLIVAIGAFYVIVPPLIVGRGVPLALASQIAFIALTLTTVPFIGVNVVWLWLYMPIMLAFTWQPRALVLIAIAVTIGAQSVVLAAVGDFADLWYAVALTGSIGIMMFAFSQQIQVTIRLRQAQGEVARLAVVEERERFARDLHDVLGHSLTVVTVKSELARRLVGADPDRAEAELADIERMTRSALADLRSAVAGYREMSLDTELAAAQAALTAAGVVPHLPTSAAGVDPELRELFAWVLRESVTNVIRHSGAQHCWVAIERRSLAIGDDGRGGARLARAPGSAAGDGDVPGSGLAGLARRAESVGATFTVEPGAEGGTTVTVIGGTS